MPNAHLDQRPLRAAMGRLGLDTEQALCRALLLDGFRIAPSTLHRLLTQDTYDPRMVTLQALCRTLGIKFRAPVDSEGNTDIEQLEAAMRRHGLGRMELWRTMVEGGYEGTFSSVRHVLDARIQSPRVSTMQAICTALGLPFVAPIRR